MTSISGPRPQVFVQPTPEQNAAGITSVPQVQLPEGGAPLTAQQNAFVSKVAARADGKGVAGESAVHVAESAVHLDADMDAKAKGAGFAATDNGYIQAATAAGQGDIAKLKVKAKNDGIEFSRDGVITPKEREKLGLDTQAINITGSVQRFKGEMSSICQQAGVEATPENYVKLASSPEEAAQRQGRVNLVAKSEEYAKGGLTTPQNNELRADAQALRNSASRRV
jgi:hypothetical protein